MSLGHATWYGRHKRASRRIQPDLRTFLPVIGVLFCFASSATVITAAEKVPLYKNSGSDRYFKTSISSTSKLSAAPAGIRPVLRLP